MGFSGQFGDNAANSPITPSPTGVILLVVCGGGREHAAWTGLTAATPVQSVQSV